MADPWPTIHEERGILAKDVSSLTGEQWATPSLCAGWTVRDVLGHMTATAKMTPPKCFLALAGAGSKFNEMSTREITNSWLGETVIHGTDIRRPPGMTRDFPEQALVQAADFFPGSNLLIGTHEGGWGGGWGIDGLRLQATDATWSTGTGPEVSGPLLSLIMAMTGRQAVLGDLSGDGVGQLRERG